MLPRHQIKGNVRPLCKLVRPLCLRGRSFKAVGFCVGLLILDQLSVSLLLYSVYSALPFIAQGWVHRNVVARFTGLRYASQNGQDLYLHDRFFRGCTRPGVFVEFGMSDGVTNSNTYFFETQLAWRTSSTPRPRDLAATSCERRCRCRPLASCLTPSVDISIPASLDRAAIANEGEQKGKKGWSTETVACTTLQALLEQTGFRHIQLVSIDTEGTELAIMTAFPWHDFVIDVVQVEVITTTPGLLDAMTRFMQGVGYDLDAVLDVTGSLHTVDVVFERTERADLLGPLFARSVASPPPPPSSTNSH
jgi:hypothetical protein